jgi:hypothetical protein
MAKKSRPPKGMLPAGAGSPLRCSAKTAVASAAASPPVAAPAASAVTIGHASAAPPPSSDPDEATEPDEAPDEAAAPLAKCAGKSNEADSAENTGPTVKEGGKKNPAKRSSAALFASSSDSDSDYSTANDVAAAAEPLAKQARGRKLPAKRGKAGTETKKNPVKKAKMTVDKVCHQ